MGMDKILGGPPPTKRDEPSGITEIEIETGGIETVTETVIGSVNLIVKRKLRRRKDREAAAEIDREVQNTRKARKTERNVIKKTGTETKIRKKKGIKKEKTEKLQRK